MEEPHDTLQPPQSTPDIGGQATIVELLREQNDLLKKLYDLQFGQLKAHKQRELLQLGIKMLPFALMFLAFLWLYWSVTSTLADLTGQVGDIRENVRSVFGLLTDQFGRLNENFGRLLQGLGSLLPDFGEITDSLKDRFL